MQKLKINILIVLIVCLLCLVSCDNEQCNVTKVNLVEDHFVSVSDAKFHDKELSYFFLDDCIYICDNNVVVYHTSIENEKFIVEYADNYYINADWLSLMEWMDGYDAITVFNLPAGFVSLDSVLEENDTLECEFFESGVFFTNDEKNIFQTVLTDSDFIVKYKNIYYISEKYLPKLLEI